MTIAAVEEQTPEQPTDERPILAAVCDECKRTVAFRFLSSGAGYLIINHGYEDQEASFGVGPNGGPVCPLGHGEMFVDYDRGVPASEAISQVAEKVNGAQQLGLPGVGAELFNFKDCYLELERKFQERKRLKATEDEDHERYKDSKKAREKCDEVLSKMGTTFAEWRAQKASQSEPGSEVATGLCRFEQLHPGVPCPLSHDGIDPEVLGSESHGIEANDFLVDRECEQTIAQLALVPHVGFTVAILRALDVQQLSILQAWAGDFADHPERREELRAELPKALAKAHVAGEAVAADADSAPVQVCTVCGAELFIVSEGEQPFLVGTLVSNDCAGRAKKDGHRYPKASKRKQTRRKAEA